MISWSAAVLYDAVAAVVKLIIERSNIAELRSAFYAVLFYRALRGVMYAPTLYSTP